MLKKVLALFFTVMFIIGTDTFLISPLLPTLRRVYGVSTEMSGWMVSAYALGYAIFALLAGPISDGLNRKKIMSIGMAAFAISTFLCGLAPNFWSMFVFRFLAGVSAAFVTPQVWASIPVLVPPPKIVKSMGIATAGLSISQMFGLPIGGYLASINWSAPFFTISLLSLLLIFPIHFIVPDIKPQNSSLVSVSIVKRYKELLKEPPAKKAFFAYFIFQTGNFAAFSFIGTWFSDKFGLNVAEIGSAMLILGLGNTLGSLFGGNIVKRIGQPKTLILGIGILALLYAVLPNSTSLSLAELNFSIIFFLGGLIFPVIMSLLQTLSSSARGTIAAIANTSMYSGTTIGAFLGGILYAKFYGFLSIGIFTTILYLISILFFVNSGILRSQQPQNKSALTNVSK